MGEPAPGGRSHTPGLRGDNRQAVAYDYSARIEAETVRRSNFTFDQPRSHPRPRKPVKGPA